MRTLFFIFLFTSFFGGSCIAFGIRQLLLTIRDIKHYGIDINFVLDIIMSCVLTATGFLSCTVSFLSCHILY